MKLSVKRGHNLSLLHDVIALLANNEPFPLKSATMHLQTQRIQNVRESHIEPDWLLIYQCYDNLLILDLLRTGRHSDRF
ncbi:MAG: type II toxin-antitoxin system YafQ family toxin [Desulfovibrionaceae bacterium]|nr:type II toxin-antitoxin system YafQ family toxin [Desulfovibrionaceae bacterium]